MRLTSLPLLLLSPARFLQNQGFVGQKANIGGEKPKKESEKEGIASSEAFPTRWRRTEKGIKLERFAVLKEFRMHGVGRALVEAVLKDFFRMETKPGTIYLHAQLQAIPFYEKSGFVAFGEVFSEADIQHRIMYFENNEPGRQIAG